MNKTLPTYEALRDSLRALNHAGLRQLADASAVPFGTLMKVRQGTTEDPRLSTVQAILQHLPRIRKASV